MGHQYNVSQKKRPAEIDLFPEYSQPWIGLKLHSLNAYLSKDENMISLKFHLKKGISTNG